MLRLLIYLFVICTNVLLGCSNNKDVTNNENELKNGGRNSLISRLSVNDTLFIEYYTRGCFHSRHEVIQIYKMEDKIHVSLFLPIQRGEILRLTTPLADSSIKAYSEFEREGKELKTKNTCTTSEDFTISLKRTIIKFQDNACRFDGYRILKYKLFGQEKIERIDDEIYR